MSRNLILLFDGTWNKRSDETNVTRMRRSIESRGEDDPQQPLFYDEGVGTHWYDKLPGAFGQGLSENIRQGYAWLAKKHQEGDPIFVFGFSRGAYTARSLVGLVRKCGILKAPDEDRVDKAYDLYRNRDVAPDHSEAKRFRAENSVETRVRFIGVWDTVGALGIPATGFLFSRDYYRWHDTELSKIVDFAYHAIAVDERRKDYGVTVWTRAKPENKEVEQRWFVGAHANVGGGYDKKPKDLLPNPPLRWIQDKAEAAGLKLRHKVEVGSADHLAEVNNSFREFMFGIYRWFKKERHRRVGSGVNETIDESVWDRCRRFPGYLSPTLKKHPDAPSAERPAPVRGAPGR